MEENEFKDLLGGLSKEGAQDAFDYEGYGLVSNLKLTREDIKKAVDIIWDMTMVCSRKERDDKYLFPFGIIKSKEMFLQQREKMTSTTPQNKQLAFDTQSSIMRERLTNIEPLILFAIKMREVL